MFKLLTICAAIAVMKKVEAGHNYAGSSANAGASAGAFAGNYGADNGADYADAAAGLNFGPIGNPFAFHQQLLSSIFNQNAALQQASYGVGHGAGYGNGIGAGTTYGSGQGNQAAASASIGPDGIYQSAYINPPNADSPNIVNRFSRPSDAGGFKSVSVSSFSSSSDAGQKRGASTVINDNGKISKYTVHS